MVDLLDETAIIASLSPSTRSWLRILRVFQEIGSTNTALLEHAAAEPVDGVVFCAEQQTEGRGRRGRTWVSPPGKNIAMSIGHAFDRSPSRLGGLSLVVGLAVIDALSATGVNGLELKWPNDVLLSGRKAGGILVELANAVAPVNVVIGIGLNVGGGAEVSGRVDQPVADLLEACPGLSRNRATSALIDAVHDFCRIFESEGFAPMRDAWTRMHALQDRAVDISIGDRRETGRVVGVTEHGALVVEERGQRRELLAGEVSVRVAS